MRISDWSSDVCSSDLCRAQPRLMRAARRRRDRVAIPAIRAGGPERPGDRPLGPALFARKFLPPDEGLGGRAFARTELLLEMIGKAAGDCEPRRGRTRKSGGEGKTVAVRGAWGGAREIKHKHK